MFLNKKCETVNITGWWNIVYRIIILLLKSMFSSIETTMIGMKNTKSLVFQAGTAENVSWMSWN